MVRSRGDVQPFIAYGTALRQYGHRVRITTHNNFANFMRESGLEFYPIGGDPADLMAYIVRNPGLIPSLESLRRGDIERKRQMIKEMLDGCWEACFHPDPLNHKPFIANAIIANPPSFAHVHCATKAFPHPLANFKKSNIKPSTANWLSYRVVEIMTWQGLRDIINDWRRKTLGLNTIQASIDVCGFFMRDEPTYTPPPELNHFLHAGPPPVYVGFGSIIIDNPQRLTNIILEATKKCGIHKVLYLGDCPHEWLFKQVSVIMHHGGAGTTVCSLVNARPTIIIPFFGDQPFWGRVVASIGAGPHPIPHQELTVDTLVEALQYCLLDEANNAAQQIALRIRAEKGVNNAVASLHHNFPVKAITYNTLPQCAATWLYKKKGHVLKLSNLAAATLLAEKKLKKSDLKPEATAMAAGKNISKVYRAMTKGALLDLPLAFTEGLRNAPKLYGAEANNYSQVKD
ncbi:hypothetical protein BKA59DRAFT_492669 [Fusarium tricinctum]|uniref:Glycosyltransferase family 28 N-terminal domain-containing protein n=1 Tax=Fusarium tricinctum TaxID=61284 RepID=A0A8K0RUK2_9HYPO|nr:hypothetical protein BKA59DRAFT_492669 [Fusarium tricinctum]